MQKNVEQIIETIHQYYADPLHPNRIRRLRSRWGWRWLVEPLLNGFGRAMGWGVRAGGLPTVETFHAWVFARLTHRPPQALNPASHRAMTAAAQLARRLHVEGTAQPCLLILTSHPRALDPPGHLLYELYRQAFALNRRLGEVLSARSYPRIVLAVDSFALEGVPPITAAVYAGLVHSLHICLDRQPSQQSWWQRVWGLRGGEAWSAGFRLLHRVQQLGGAAALAWGGAEPQNARLLYTAREFINRIGRQYHLPPKRRQALLIRTVTLLVGQASDQGNLSAAQQHMFQTLLQEEGIPVSQVVRLADAFSQEFQRATPYRERLMDTVVARLLHRNRTVLLIPVRHQRVDGTVQVAAPSGLQESLGSGIRRFWADPGGTIHTEAIPDLGTFTREFITQSFPEDAAA